MTRLCALVTIFAVACSTGHSNTGTDGAVIDSAVAVIDSASAIDAPGAADAKPGTIDATPGTIDATPGTPDAKVFDAAPGTPDAKPAPDANTCPVLPCTLSPQCGCPANQSCDIDPADLMGNVCRAVNVPGKETSSCSSFSECATGYVCVGGECERYCDDNTDCAQPRGQCVVQLVDANQAAIPGAVVCSSNCDPGVANNSAYCPSAASKCGIFTATFGGADHDIAACTAPGTGVHGTACTDDSTCGVQTLCTNVGTLACRRICKVTSDCSGLAGTSCLHFSTPLTIGGTEYGVCGP